MFKLRQFGQSIINPKKLMDSPANKNQVIRGVVLNAYPDSLGGSSDYLVRLLSQKPLTGIFKSIYLLPTVFHSDLDRGFSIIDYDLNEPLIEHRDLKKINDLGIELKLDIVLNHLSVGAPEFRDLMANGDQSPYVDFFINWNEFWRDHGTVNQDGIVIPHPEYKEKLFTRKPGLPILQVPFPDHSFRPYWNTFYQKITLSEDFIQACTSTLSLSRAQSKHLHSQIEQKLLSGHDPTTTIKSLGYKPSEIVPIIREHLHLLGQMDLNAQNSMVWQYYQNTLKKLKDYGGHIIRLDAFAYLHKSPGAHNFFNVPETWQYLDRLKQFAQENDLVVLPEIHAQYGKYLHQKVSAKGYPIYDFFLPGLIIHTLENKDASPLLQWTQEVQDQGMKLINMLGCHDGIPLLDLDADPDHPEQSKGLLSTIQIEELIQKVVSRGGRVKNLYGPDGKKIGYYQVNATYFSALNEDQEKMLIARALQLFMPGTPQIWYLDLFAGTNDYAAADSESGNHKEINRTNLSPSDIEAKMGSKLVLKQLELIELRAKHPAFDGSLTTQYGHNKVIEFHWTHGDQWAKLEVNLPHQTYSITHT